MISHPSDASLPVGDVEVRVCNLVKILFCGAMADHTSKPRIAVISIATPSAFAHVVI